MKRTWYFIDIDGCIMPNIFNNQFYKNDKEKLEVIANVYQKVVNEKIQLYPQFIQWFHKISQQINTFRVYFITGRQKDVFGFLTRYQLQPLMKMYPFIRIKFYPDFSTHNWEEYKEFKNESICESLEKEIYYNDIIKIYDDLDFLDDLTKFTLEQHEFYQITKPEDWEKL